MKDEIKFLDAVAIVEDLPEFGLKRGESARLLTLAAFEVEFSDESGEPYAFVALQAEKLMPLYHRHRKAT